MYRFDSNETHLYAALLDEAEAAGRLSADLTRLASGRPICEKAIEAAPVFERYLFVTKQTVVCMGYRRTPGGEDPIFTHTDDVVVDARNDGWIRTRTRLYKVGLQCHHPFER